MDSVEWYLQIPLIPLIPVSEICLLEPRQRIQTKILRIASGFGSYFTAENGDDKTTNIFLFLFSTTSPTSPRPTSSMVVEPKEDGNDQVRPFKLIDFFGSHLTHATSQRLTPLPKSWSPQNGISNCSEAFSLLFSYHYLLFVVVVRVGDDAFWFSMSPLSIYVCGGGHQ